MFPRDTGRKNLEIARFIPSEREGKIVELNAAWILPRRFALKPRGGSTGAGKDLGTHRALRGQKIDRIQGSVADSVAEWP
jgi:hypothetical protein